MINGIPFDDLDREMVPIVKFLNFKANLKTKYCCFGHKKRDHFYIMFDDSVSFEEGLKAAEKCSSSLDPGIAAFKYWVRKGSRNKVLKNWILESNGARPVKQRYLIARTLITSLEKQYENHT